MPPESIVAAGTALRAGETTCVALTTDALARADALDPALGVYVDRYDDAALDAAAALDAELAAGHDRGPLHGVPVGVKDIVATREGPTTGNSRVDYPAWRQRDDAPAVARLRAAGAVVLGKATTMELAVGVPDEALPFAIPRNPWDPERYSGGSSSGSASGVAAGLFCGALGTDTAGSIRIPASYCGVTGFKGTYGTVPNRGIMPLAPSLDTAGPLARSARDAGLLLDALAGHDPADPSSSPRAPDPAPRHEGLRGLRIGVERVNHLHGDLADPELVLVFERAVAALEAAGAEVVEVEIPLYRELTDSVLLTMFAEGLGWHHRALREQWDRFGRSARVAFASAACLSAHEYVAAQKVRRLGRRLVGELLERVDLVACPTTATTAPALAGLDLSRMISTLFTNLWSGPGCPVVSVPMGRGADGLPLGMQLAGRPFADRTVLAAAAAYQRATDWHRAWPAAVPA